LVSSVGAGEFAFEEESDGVEAVAAERGQGGESERTEHACGDVVGRGGAVTAEQKVEGPPQPGDAEAVAVEQQGMLGGEPLQGDEVESLP